MKSDYSVFEDTFTHFILTFISFCLSMATPLLNLKSH